MDTQFSRRVTTLIDTITDELHGKYGSGNAFTLTPVGAYRAALDNEINAKKNVRRAVIFSTVAIAMLLFVGFPRPLIGLLALLPAFAGTMMALFVYSLFHPSISMLAVGFGGAIISFTVDYGITYLLFLDRPYETRGLEATKEVWSLGLLAMLTTAVSFAFLVFEWFSCPDTDRAVCCPGRHIHLYFCACLFPPCISRHASCETLSLSAAPAHREQNRVVRRHVENVCRTGVRACDAPFRQT